MGLLDDLAGQTLGGGGAQNVLGAVVGMLGNPQTGGLSGLVQQFTGNGLGDIVSSWVGKGQNLPITAQQIHQGLGSDMIHKLAAQAGISSDQLTSQLSALLPNVVDQLTPDGRVEPGDMMSKGMDLLKGFLR